MAVIWLFAAFTSTKPPGNSTCLSSGASAWLRDKPNGGQARLGIEQSRPPLPSRMACQKLLTRRSVCFSTQAGRLDATPETSKCLASFMPVGDGRSTAVKPVESHPRCGGGPAFALPSEAPLRAEERSWRARTPRMIALDMLSVRERFGCFNHPSLSSPCSLALFLFCWASRDNSAPISRTDWRRSSLYRPAAQLSGDDKGAPTDRARTIGRGGPQLCTQHLQSADSSPRDFRRATLVVRGVSISVAMLSGESHA